MILNTGIYIDNELIKTNPLECKRKLAYIPDNPDLFQITNALAQPISTYSHDMKQKLAIISAWIHEPKFIIMDEPFVGLAPKAVHKLKGMMRNLCDNGGAIFFSTHVLEVAEKLCDKVAIIKGGKLIKSGTMEEVKSDDSLEDVFLMVGMAAIVLGACGSVFGTYSSLYVSNDNDFAGITSNTGKKRYNGKTYKCIYNGIYYNTICHSILDGYRSDSFNYNMFYYIYIYYIMDCINIVMCAWVVCC